MTLQELQKALRELLPGVFYLVVKQDPSRVLVTYAVPWYRWPFLPSAKRVRQVLIERMPCTVQLHIDARISWRFW